LMVRYSLTRRDATALRIYEGRRLYVQKAPGREGVVYRAGDDVFMRGYSMELMDPTRDHHFWKGTA
jgi:hypothetical protein